MSFKHKMNSGSLFRNDGRTEGQPNFSGSCMIDGKEYDIGAWTNESKDGKKGYFGLKFTLKQSMPEQGK